MIPVVPWAVLWAVVAALALPGPAFGHPSKEERVAALERDLSAPTADHWLESARLAISDDRFDEAEGDLDRARRAGADEARLALARALLETGRGRPVEALAALEHAERLDPSGLVSRLRRARLLGALGRFGEASAAWLALLERADVPGPELVAEASKALERAGLDTNVLAVRGPAGSHEEAGRESGGQQRGNRRRATERGPSSPVAVVAQGAVWSYLDDGSDLGELWAAPGYDDGLWSSGPAELGYGDGDEDTVLSYGPDPSQKFTTTYFRHTFELAGAASVAWAEIRLLRDDGARVFLNGVEVARSNLPEGPIAFDTWASGVGQAGEGVFLHLPIDPATLVEGTNVLAVEVHQRAPDSSDLSFDLELRVDTAPVNVVRGPYLQMVGPSQVEVRWWTDASTGGSRVRYGLERGTPALVADDLETDVVTSFLGTVWDHRVLIEGLPPETRYHYSIGSPDLALVGSDGMHTWRTSPPPRSRRSTRVWVLGDSGTANANARAVRDAYVLAAGDRPADLWWMLGDNAYPSGTDAEYQAAVFETYPDQLRSMPLWPVLGNHDGLSASSVTQTGPYFENFTLPTLGEIGGLASGTEAYYSFDVADLHVIVLDSHDSDRSIGGPMLSWLEDDLVLANQDPTPTWVVALWHHPPYSKGSHDSDAPAENRMREMRENVLPILDLWGVDLVLTGHSHAYERSVLLDGHYDVSGTLDPSMVLDDGDGHAASDGAYSKSTLGPAAHQGTIYVVGGSSGKVNAVGSHPVMHVALAELGSLLLDFDGELLIGRFVRSDGTFGDVFHLQKGPEEPVLFFGDFELGNTSRWTAAVP